MAIEPRFRGLWQTPDSRVRIKDDDWYYWLGQAPYTITNGGNTLTYGSVYARVYGAGANLLGVWRMTQVDGGFTWTEELNFSTVQTYTSAWTRDGQPDSIYYGIYAATGNTISTEEKRLWITTAAGGNISLHVPYGTDQTGTYEFATDDKFTLTLGGIAVEYTRVV